MDSPFVVDNSFETVGGKSSFWEGRFGPGGQVPWLFLDWATEAIDVTKHYLNNLPLTPPLINIFMLK
jgi:hypothetical protein